MGKSALCAVFLFLFIGVFAFAQSNTTVDVLLEQEQAIFGESAYLVLASAGIISEDASAEDALRALNEAGWLKNPVVSGEPVKLGVYSFMMMKAYGIKGGLLYRIFPGPRYAARELGSRGLLGEHVSPYRIITGEEAVRFLGNFLEWKEALK